MKLLIIATILMVSNIANAGFLTGVVIGAALSDDSTVQRSSTELIASDINNVIICEKMSRKNECAVTTDINGVYTVSLTPIEYTKYSGYSVLVRQAAIIQNNKQYIAMEVN